jgi:ribosomal protein S27E
MNYVVIARYGTPWEAHVARALLESEGIEARLLDEHMVGANWTQALAIGEVKLAVPETQSGAAQELLALVAAGALALDPIDSDDNGAPAKLICTSCGSTSLEPTPSPADRAIAVVNYALFGVFHPAKRSAIRCRACGATVRQGAN